MHINNYHDEQLNKLSHSITQIATLPADYSADDLCDTTDDLYDVEKSYELLAQQVLLLDDYLHDKESLSTFETSTIKKLVNAMKEGK